ncbi:monocarboxylate transporter 12-like [Glandiceps talaboti]
MKQTHARSKSLESSSDSRYGNQLQSDVNDQNDRISTDELDGGIYGWLVVFACHVCYMFVSGMFQSIGPIFVALQTSFGSGSARTSWIISVTASVEMTIAPLTNIFVKKIGYRGTVILGGIMSSIGLLLTAFAPTLEFVYFSFGVLFGFGHGLIVYPSIGLIPLYIKKRYALANALVVSGSGLGIFIFTPLWQVLIETYGWRGAFIVFSAINANVCVCGTLLKVPKITKKKMEMTKAQHFDDKSTSRNNYAVQSTANTTALRQLSEICDFHLYMKYPTLVVIAFSMFLGVGVGHFGATAYIVVRAKSKSLSSERNIALIMSIYGVVNVLGILSSPVLLRFAPRSVTSTGLYGLAMFLAGITNLMSPLADSYSTYCVYTAFLGLSSGVTLTLYSNATNDIVGASNLTAALCVISPWACVGGLIGPPVAGWIYDITKDYNNSFYFYGSCMVFAGLTTFLFEPIRRLCHGEKTSDQEASDDTREHIH